MKTIKASSVSESQKYVEFPFYFKGNALESGPKWGMTLKAASSMRFRWNEENPVRKEMLSLIADGKNIESIELIHSKIVCFCENSGDCFNKTGDGIITKNKNIMPVVTVADCMPLYIFDFESGAFGVVHSGWKGTGIIIEAVSMMKSKCNSKAENLCVAIGAHIHDCCYVVDEERASYFTSNFGKDCVTPVLKGEVLCKGEASAVSSWKNGNGPLFRLSLLKANLFCIEKAGIDFDNVVVLDECTCCNPIFGSNRRETAGGKNFTVQAAFVKW